MIPNTKARNQKENLSWIDDKDFILFIKNWAKKKGENKFF